MLFAFADLQPRYIYALIEPTNFLLGYEYNDLLKPTCYIGVAKDPFADVSDLINKASRNRNKLSTWLQELDGILEARPELVILESTISTYTHGDAHKILKAWRWAGYLAGYNLVSNQRSYYSQENFHQENLTVREMAIDREVTVGSHTLSVFKNILGLQSHKRTIASIKPYFGYSLVCDNGSIHYYEAQEERSEALKQYMDNREARRIEKDPVQYKQHLAIVDERAERCHPLKLAKWKARPIIKEASSWEKLEEELWEWRWTIHRLPRGGVLFNGKYPVRLKKIHPDFALEKLEERFGQVLMG
ncbi:hypothetical protein [Fodinibius salsisoli]|uniref:Uncharacterized protein n=1 Tax=Fodinibius salsisoli TaxID=2820877 RepID=A0ABT3PHG0_9BACT|nr:hypothetical protein [Fodinibius salsisoli]MCW9705223.1 hypothetical protein [Fodinibius salsisoli]